MNLNILIVDDDSVDRMLIERHLKNKHLNINITQSESGCDAIELISQNNFDCAFLDYRLPDMDGLSILKALQDNEFKMPPLPIVILTGQGSESVMLEAIRFGAQDYLIKDHISADSLNIALIKSKQSYQLQKTISVQQQSLKHTVEKRTADYQYASKSLQLHEAIVEFSNDAVLLANTAKNGTGLTITYTNSALTRISGFSKHELIGQPLTFLQGHNINKSAVSAIQAAVSNSIPYKGEIQSRTKSGEDYWLSLSLYPIPSDDNEVNNFAAIGRDITAKKKVYEELEKTKEQAEKANRAKNDFLANMSHELRTPMNSIIGLTKILLSEPHLSSDQKDTLKVIDSSSAALLKIVNDILDLSKIDAGHTKLEPRDFCLNDTIKSILDQTRPLANAQKLTLTDNLNNIKKTVLHGDDFRLNRIIVNLLSNAIKYTKKGSISMELELSESESDSEIVNFICTVRDTGIGIPEDKIDHIFDKFTQVEESAARHFGGTGLGLNITKKLAILMNGQIKVHSTYGKGSAFTITIPFKRSDDTRANDAPSKQDKPEAKCVDITAACAKILIAEDHEFNQVLISKLLHRAGCSDFTLAQDGTQTVQKFKDSNASYNLILMDCHMPNMNGYEATRAIRAIESEHGTHQIPIIAMTADAMVGTREQCLKAGMNDYVSKPIDEYDFRCALSKWISLPHDTPNLSSAQSQSDAQTERPANLSILNDYADNDHELVKELVQSFIEKSAADVLLLQNNYNKECAKIWKEAAHALKGSASYVGAVQLVNLCEQAQSLPLSTSSTNRWNLLNKIDAEYSRVCEYIKSQV